MTIRTPHSDDDIKSDNHQYNMAAYFTTIFVVFWCDNRVPAIYWAVSLKDVNLIADQNM